MGVSVDFVARQQNRVQKKEEGVSCWRHDKQAVTAV